MYLIGDKYAAELQMQIFVSHKAESGDKMSTDGDRHKNYRYVLIKDSLKYSLEEVIMKLS